MVVSSLRFIDIIFNIYYNITMKCKALYVDPNFHMHYPLIIMMNCESYLCRTLHSRTKMAANIQGVRG